MTTPTEKDAMALAAVDSAAHALKYAGAKHEGVQQVIEARAHLAARIAGLEAELARVRRAAKMGMDAAHNIAAHDLALGRRMQAESKPEAVASEREANSMLTEILDAAEARATRAEAELAAVREDAENYRWLRDSPEAFMLVENALYHGGQKLDDAIKAARSTDTPPT